MSNDDLLKDLFSTLQDCERFCFLTKAEEFQLQSIKKLEFLKGRVLENKEKAISEKNEKMANVLLSAEYAIEALISELKMWIELKNEGYDKAWDLLVTAQDCIRNSFQANADTEFNFDGHSIKLFFIEKIIFPKFAFLSPGLVIESTRCSICNKNYDECTHIVGKAYMGKLCYQIVDKIKEIREVSIVESPANKHARITSFTEDGITRDILTWKEVKKHLNNKGVKI